MFIDDSQSCAHFRAYPPSLNEHKQAIIGLLWSPGKARENWQVAGAPAAAKMTHRSKWAEICRTANETLTSGEEVSRAAEGILLMLLWWRSPRAGPRPLGAGELRQQRQRERRQLQPRHCRNESFPARLSPSLLSLFADVKLL